MAADRQLTDASAERLDGSLATTASPFTACVADRGDFTDHPAVSNEQYDEKKGDHVEEFTTEAVVPEQTTDSAPPNPQPPSEKKNPFGIKPEYKTAVKDFIVSLFVSSISNKRKLISNIAYLLLLNMAGQATPCCCLHYLSRRWSYYASDEYHLW